MKKQVPYFDEAIEVFKKEKIKELFDLLTQSEKDGFYRFYKSIEDVPKNKLIIVHDLFARTINNRKEKS